MALTKSTWLEARMDPSVQFFGGIFVFPPPRIPVQRISPLTSTLAKVSVIESSNFICLGPKAQPTVQPWSDMLLIICRMHDLFHYLSL